MFWEKKEKKPTPQKEQKTRILTAEGWQRRNRKKKKTTK
jgi:hypothetical protein